MTDRPRPSPAQRYRRCRTAIVAGVLGAALLSGATPASAHSGGLDRNGCHAGSQPYHCHNSPAPAPAPAPAPTPAPAPAPEITRYDANGPTGTIYRLYRAYFLREPDEAGYRYWLNTYAGAYPLTRISDDFTRSAEFVSDYGDVTNAEFIRLVYDNVLEREPDSDGYAYWLDQMDHRGMSRGVVMINFSDSAEFRSKTADGRPPGF